LLAECPPDWTLIQWHVDPTSKCYRSPATAKRACDWLNTHLGVHDVWLFRPGPVVDGRVVLERRWVGRWDGLVGGDAEA
jgi:hypothetical protein